MIYVVIVFEGSVSYLLCFDYFSSWWLLGWLIQLLVNLIAWWLGR